MFTYVPDWQLVGEFLKAAVPSMVAVFVAYIAWQQWRTAQDKLAIDLFDRRLSALGEIQKSYMATVDAIRANFQVIDNPLLHQDRISISAFNAAIWNARWLFGEAVADKLRRLSDLLSQTGAVPFDADDESDPPDRDDRFERAIIPAHDLMYEVILALEPYMMLDRIAVGRPAKRRRLARSTA